MVTETISVLPKMGLFAFSEILSSTGATAKAWGHELSPAILHLFWPLEKSENNEAKMTIRKNLNPDGDILGAVPPETNVHNVRNMAKRLQTGTPSQKTLVLFEMPQLLANCAEETLNILVPAICLFVERWDEDLQIATAEALLDVVEHPIPASTKGIIIQAALHVISDVDSEDLLESWGEILVLILPTTHLETDSKVRSVTGLLGAFARSDISACRKLAARVFGAVAPSISAEKVEIHILDHALKLFDDPDPEIRGMVAESMAFIGGVTSEETTETRVWPKIWGLLQDPDLRIRAVTLRTIASILQSQRTKGLDVGPFSKLLHPVLLDQAAFARRSAEEDQRAIDDNMFLMLEMFSEVFGQFVYSCAIHFPNASVKEDLFKAFEAMATCNGPTVRRFCAFNLPGVCITFGATHAVQLSGIVHALSIDMDTETRCNLAAGMHQTVQALISNEAADTLYNAVAALLRDENPLVRMKILENFFMLLSAFGPDISSTQRLAPIFQILIGTYEGNWRTQELLAKQLQDAVSLIPSDCLRRFVLPLLYRLAEDCTYLVRKSAMLAVAKALWHIPLQLEREVAMRTFRIEWGEGGVYWMRMAFIDCAEAAMDCYSRKLFGNLFLETLLYLADDPVSNVRLRLGKIMPKLAELCTDASFLNRVISGLKVDPDKDVRDVMGDIESKLADVERNKDMFEAEDQKRAHAEAELELKAEKLNNESAIRGIPKPPDLMTKHPSFMELCSPKGSDDEPVLPQSLSSLQEDCVAVSPTEEMVPSSSLREGNSAVSSMREPIDEISPENESVPTSSSAGGSEAISPEKECTPNSCLVEGPEAASPTKKMVPSLSLRGSENSGKASRPLSPRKGILSFLQLGAGNGNEEDGGSAKGFSLPRIVTSPINSPVSGAQEGLSNSERDSDVPLSPRRKGLQMLRELGWVKRWG